MAEICGSLSDVEEAACDDIGPSSSCENQGLYDHLASDNYATPTTHAPSGSDASDVDNPHEADDDEEEDEEDGIINSDADGSHDDDDDEANEDKELELYYSLFKYRYTVSDSEYAKIVQRPRPMPPVVYPWGDRPKRNFDYSGRSRFRGRGPRRGGGGGERGRGRGHYRGGGDRQPQAWGEGQQHYNREGRGRGNDRARGAGRDCMTAARPMADQACHGGGVDRGMKRERHPSGSDDEGPTVRGRGAPVAKQQRQN